MWVTGEEADEAVAIAFDTAQWGTWYYRTTPERLEEMLGHFRALGFTPRVMEIG